MCDVRVELGESKYFFKLKNQIIIFSQVLQGDDPLVKVGIVIIVLIIKYRLESS